MSGELSLVLLYAMCCGEMTNMLKIKHSKGTWMWTKKVVESCLGASILLEGLVKTGS